MRPPQPDHDETDDRLGELDGVVRSIGDHARGVNLSRARSLAAALDQADRGQLGERGRATAVDVAHQLLGSAGTFGFTDASGLAARLEDFFAAGDFDEPGRQEARRQVKSLLDQLDAGPAR